MLSGHAGTLSGSSIGSGAKFFVEVRHVGVATEKAGLAMKDNALPWLLQFDRCLDVGTAGAHGLGILKLNLASRKGASLWAVSMSSTCALKQSLVCEVEPLK